MFSLVTLTLTIVAGLSQSLSDLACAGRLIMGFAWADSTRKTLNSEQKTFLEFLQKYSISEWPVSGDTLVLYCSFLITSGRLKSVGSVKQYLSAASTLHKMFGLSCHVPSSYGPLNMIVKGIDRSFSVPERKRLPITTDILCNLIWGLQPFINTSNLEIRSLALALKALYLILFFSMLRGGNALPVTVNEFNHVRHLSWGRIESVVDGAVIRIPLSKTIQAGERVHEIPIARCDVSATCSIAALSDLIRLKGAAQCHAQDSVFSVFKQNSWTCLTKPVAGKFLAGQLSSMGLNARLYGLHSFRFGSLMQGVEGNNSIAFLRLHSDHKSDAIYGYLHMPAIRRFGVAKNLARDLSLTAMRAGMYV